MSDKLNKVVIFGIDGGSLKLIEQWKEELPNLRRIMEGGVYGELESTIPPVTCPAWPCMFTGKNPGKIGMYGFISVEDSGEFRITVRNSLDYHQCSLWKILNDSSISVGLLNVAMTFPPHKIDSFMVCGTGSPVGGRASYTYPARLKKELDNAVPGYEVLPPIVATIRGKEREYKEILERAISNRFKAAKYLLSNFPWDLFVGVFFSLDTAQHYFWHHMDKAHPWHEGGGYRNVIEDCYKKIDTAIGELIKELPRETNILIVSDHGFDACHRSFVVSRWLEKEGLLVFSQPAGNKISSPWLWRIRDFLLSVLGARITRFIAGMVPEWLSIKLSSREKSGYKVAEIYRNIDWSKTKAYPEGSTNMIRINLKDREPQGIIKPGEEYEELVNDIVNRMKNITDPELGQPISIKIFRGDEIYYGGYADKGPDIAFYIDKCMPASYGSQNSEWAEPPYSGWHVRQGVFMAYGPDIKSSGEKLKSLRIYDITPTVLHMFGLPISGDMDGKVLSEIFEPDSEPGRRPVVYEPAGMKDELKDKIRKLKNSGKI